MRHITRIILLLATLLGSASAFAADHGQFSTNCTYGAGMVNNTVTAKVGDTFTVTVPSGPDCFLSISPAGGVTWTVVGGSPTSVFANGTATVTIRAAGTLTFVAQQDGAGRTITINATGAAQTITFNPQAANPSTYSPGGSFTINPLATASSGLAVAYAATPNTVCTLVGTGPTVNIVGAGTCTITATQLGNGNWNAATPVSQNVKINQAPQTLTFPQQNPNKRTFVVGTTFPVAPLANTSPPHSGNPVVYTSRTPAVCGVMGSTVTMLKAGTCTLVATQAATGNFLVGEATQDVTLVAPPVPPTPVPTLGEWSLMLLGLLAAGLGVHGLRQRAHA